MKNAANLNNTLIYQYLKAARLVLTSTLLSTSLILTACSSDNETATKKDPKDKPSPKPTQPTNKHLAYDALGALLNIGLFSIERATEIAIKENKATHLVTENDCQKAEATAVGTNKTIQVTTLRGKCLDSKKSAVKWEGNETLKATIDDGIMKSLSNSLSDVFEIETAGRTHLYTIKQRTSLTPSTSTAANTVFDLNSLIDINVQMKNGDKIRKIQFAIQIIGMAQISQSTGKMTAIAINTAEIFINREDRAKNQETTSTITLTPDTSGLVPLTCGQYTGRMNMDQTLNSTSSRSEIKFKAALLFSNKEVRDSKDTAMTTPVAACTPGFESIEKNLAVAGKKAIDLLAARKPEASREDESADNETNEEIVSE